MVFMTKTMWMRYFVNVSLKNTQECSMQTVAQLCILINLARYTCIVYFMVPRWVNCNFRKISNHMSIKRRDQITYPFPNFNGCTVEVWDWISNFIMQFTMDAITSPWVNGSTFLIARITATTMPIPVDLTGLDLCLVSLERCIEG